MSERNREWSEGAIMHLINRGNEKKEIFLDGYDYEFFRGLLKDAAGEHGYKIIALCGLPNHFHILAKTSDYPLGEWMKGIQVSYARYFNDRYERCGHLFGGRYRSRRIDNQQYLLEASLYIHLNAVRAGLVSRPEDYRFSSYRTYIGLSKDPLICPEEVLKYVNGPDPIANYREFVESAIIPRSLATRPSSVTDTAEDAACME